VFTGFNGDGHPHTNGDVIIGNDVWIGANVTIMSGVTIGDGAVIAANSHVVKNVDPYCIVGGNPALMIRKRFSDEHIEKLLAIKWWLWDDDDIKTHIPLLCNDSIDTFIQEVEHRMMKTPRGKVHLVMYSDGEPFDSSKKKMMETISRCTSREVVCHPYDRSSITSCEWYHHVERVSKVPDLRKRDGLHCVYKPFITNDVFQKMGEDDILYYADCSQYFNTHKIGFCEPMDMLFDIADKFGHVAGSVSVRHSNKHSDCCTNLGIWDIVHPKGDNQKNLHLPHVCASWFLLKRNELTKTFMKEWLYYCMFTNNVFPNPLITYHHTVDQSIFNILVVKHDMYIFEDCDLSHRMTKNRNRVMKSLNAGTKREFIRKFSYFSVIEHDVQRLKELHAGIQFVGELFMEVPEQIMVLRHLRDDDCVLELGGSIGRCSCIINSIISHKSNHVVVEPSKRELDILIKNRDSNVFQFQIENAAISSKQLYSRGWYTYDTRVPNSVPVNCIHFDDFSRKYGLRFNVLVIDNEGNFVQMLKDFPTILNDIRLIQIEHDFNSQEDLDYFTQTVSAHGFKCVDSLKKTDPYGPGWKWADGVIGDPHFVSVWKRL
jgi:serine acetyltransferase